MNDTHEHPHGPSDVDELTGVSTTGHDWDGIKELNNPLPRWWLWTFYGTIVWAVIYTIFFPAWPLVTSATTGVLNYTSRGEFQQLVSQANQGRAAMAAQIADTPLEEIIANPELVRFATSAGSSAFKVNCSQCHGTGAEGGPGYPNLNDDAWIWGGTLEEIYYTVAHGVRSPTDPDTRYNIMPNFGTDQLLDRASIDAVAKYVASLSGLDGGEDTPEGAQIFADNCAACHGDGGVGMLVAFSMRVPLSVNVLHDRNPQFVLLSDGSVQNGYDIKVLNMTAEPRDVVLTLEGLDGATMTSPNMLDQSATEMSLSLEPDTVVPVRLYVKANAARVPSTTDFIVNVRSVDGEINAGAQTSFEAPEKR